jgi:hypothetical protein
MSSLGIIDMGGDEYNSPYRLKEFRLDGQVVQGDLKDLKRDYLKTRPAGVEAIYQNGNNIEKKFSLEVLLAHNSIPEYFSINPPRIFFKTDRPIPSRSFDLI